MENHPTEPVKKPFPMSLRAGLDNLLSRRGKPFVGWKEERSICGKMGDAGQAGRTGQPHDKKENKDQ